MTRDELMKSTVTPVLRAARADAAQHQTAIETARQVLADEARAIRSLPAGEERSDREAARQSAQAFLEREQLALSRRLGN